MSNQVSAGSEGFHSLIQHHGQYTKNLLTSIQSTPKRASTDALRDLVSEIVPFNERLTEYISHRFGIPNEVKPVKKLLREAGSVKGLDFSSANLSQWITKDKWEVYLSPESVFKLCLALELNIDEAQTFAYRVLHQNWLNNRNRNEAIYIFFLSMQDLFGDSAFAEANAMIIDLSDDPARPSNDKKDSMNAAGYTRYLVEGINGLANSDISSKEAARESLKEYLAANRPAFDGIRRSAIATYNTYFSEGAIGLPSLTELYYDEYGLTLPETSYLDNAYIQEDMQRKRLLWGAVGRSEWLKDNEPDLDILNTHEIRTEEHAIGRMQKKGVLRGNMIALLFFHFCFERKKSFSDGTPRDDLFADFYNIVNNTLIDQCGMMPLHPRKQLDGLFMRAVANSGLIDPIVYLNQVLADFYAQSAR